MIEAGIDYSINYPSIVIKNNNDYKFISIERVEHKKPFLFDFEHYVVLKSEDQMDDMVKLNKFILELLFNNNVEKIKIEGFSYMSTGASYIDLIMYQSILRFLCYENGIEIEVFSPKTVKKTAGKGNFGKIEMFDAFLKENINHDFYTNVLNFEDSIRKNNKLGINTDIKKPYQDIIDAYWVLKTNKE